MTIDIKLAGAVGHFSTYFMYIKELINYENINLSVYDGPNLCKWNGGRLNRDIHLTKYHVDFYNKHNIGVFLTFSNPIIDLSDKTGNELLEMLSHNPLNGIICVNEDLRKYVREKYPEYKLIYSITGHPNDITINEKLINYYKDLEKKYDVIVPRFEMPLNPLFNKAVDTSKYELITNDTCTYGCKVFREHLDSMAKANRDHNKPWEEIDFDVAYKLEECWIKDFNPDIGSDSDREKYGHLLGMDFTKKMYIESIELGFRRFKIMGRERKKEELKDDIISNLNIINEVVKEINV